MTAEDEDRGDEVEAEVEIEVDVQDESHEARERFIDSLRDRLRHSIEDIVEAAFREAGQVRGRAGVWKHRLDHEMERVREDVSRAIHAARVGFTPLDLKIVKKGLRGRRNTLMTRVKDEDARRIDLLVEGGIFNSRSEGAAFLIHAGLESRRDLIDKVETTAQKIVELKDRLREEFSED
jgi:Arc/MetJ-type ribon-helix-helix transcriptional regulator